MSDEKEFFGYRDLRLVNTGPIATIYKATSATHETVALRVMRCLACDPVKEMYIQRAEREHALLGRVNSPHVVGVKRVLIDSGKCMCICMTEMEWIDGDSLASLRRRGWPRSAKDALRVCCQTLGGLEALHSQGIVHGNISRSNIMVEKASNRTVIIDLGSNCDLGANTPMAGTRGYNAPERNCCSNPMDPRSDLYSLGVALRGCFENFSYNNTLGPFIRRLCHDAPSERPKSASDALEQFYEDVAGSSTRSSDPVDELLVEFSKVIPDGAFTRRLCHGAPSEFPKSASAAPRQPCEDVADRPTRSRDPMDELLAELAKVIFDREEAFRVVEKAGFPRPRLPEWTTSLAFWTRILREIRNGILSDKRGLIEVVASEYPGNEVFKRYHRMEW